MGPQGLLTLIKCALVNCNTCMLKKKTLKYRSTQLWFAGEEMQMDERSVRVEGGAVGGEDDMGPSAPNQNCHGMDIDMYLWFKNVLFINIVSVR